MKKATKRPMSLIDRARKEPKKAEPAPVISKTRKTISVPQSDGTFHRLSRPFSVKIPIREDIMGAKEYGEQYYEQHPEMSDDIRTPMEKLFEIDELLSKEVFGSDLIEILIKQKCLRYIEYGEISIPSAKSHLVLGEHYFKEKKISSSRRHYQKGLFIANKLSLKDDIAKALIIGLAESFLYEDDSCSKSISMAFSNISSIEKDDIIDSSLRFRRDYILGKIYFLKKMYSDSINAYKLADHTLNTYIGKTGNITEAIFYEDYSKSLLNGSLNEEAMSNSEMALKLYEDLGVPDGIKRMRNFINSLQKQDALNSTIPAESHDEINGNNPDVTEKNEEELVSSQVQGSAEETKSVSEINDD